MSVRSTIPFCEVTHSGNETRRCAEKEGRNLEDLLVLCIPQAAKESRCKDREEALAKGATLRPASEAREQVNSGTSDPRFLRFRLYDCTAQ